MEPQFNNNIGKLKLKSNTDKRTRRQLEEFFILHRLFISSVDDGIMVTDIHEAKRLIDEKRKE